MQGSHLVFLVAVVVYSEESSLVSEQLVSLRLLLNVVDEEFDEYAFLTLFDDGVCQFGEI